MTAYGSANLDGYLIEVHSVNRKGLDLNLYLPCELQLFDIDLRKILKEKIVRGSVTLRISRQKRASLDCELPSKQALESISKHFLDAGFSSDEITLPFLCDRYKEVSVEGESLDKDVILKGLKQALEALGEMKKAEGFALSKDILSRLQTLQKGVDKVEKKAASAPEFLREKLENRLKTLKVAQEDIAKEVVLFAEKCDVSEEIVRLRSHIEQFENCMKSKEVAIGRTLDFILVEMNRELNTIAAKSILHEMSDLVPLLKSECEKIREQVQNIE